MINLIRKMGNWQKISIALLHDYIVAIAAFYVALGLRYDTILVTQIKTEVLIAAMIIIPLTQALTFYTLGLYRGVWRYSSIPDLLRVVKSVSVAIVISFFAMFLYNRLSFIPRSSFIIDWFLLICGLGGGRFAFRMWVDNATYKAKQGELKKVLIIGAGAAGVQLLRELKNNPKNSLRVVGFVDDNRNLKGKIIHNVSVLGCTDEIEAIIDKSEATEAYIAIPSATGLQIKSIIKKLKNKIKVKTLPQLSDILDGKITVSQLRNIRIEDLLGRDSVKLNAEDISPMLADKMILITGAGGSIGSEICNQVSRFNPKALILFEQSEFNLYQLEATLKNRYPKLKMYSVIGDVRQRESVENAFQKFRPDVVFHAAAYKHVPIMEANPVEAIKTNVLGTKIVGETSVKYEVEKFVFVSTDKAVNPTNIMGSSKRISEIVCQDIQQKTTKTKFVTVRFGNVLGSSGSVIPLFKKQLEGGGPITVTHKDITRYFMSIPEASQLVLQAGALGKGGEIFVLDMGTPVKIYDLAKQMIHLAGLEPGVDINIEITGLRPGEKLYEELLGSMESTLPTSHEKVRVAKASVELENFDEKLSGLLNLTSINEVDHFKVAIKNIIPEYMTPEQHLEQTMKSFQ